MLAQAYPAPPYATPPAPCDAARTPAPLTLLAPLAAVPQREYHDMPLKTFYRYALPTLGSPDGGPPAPAAATFTRLPPNKVLTLGMDEPEPW